MHVNPERLVECQKSFNVDVWRVEKNLTNYRITALTALTRVRAHISVLIDVHLSGCKRCAVIATRYLRCRRALIELPVTCAYFHVEARPFFFFFFLRQFTHLLRRLVESSNKTESIPRASKWRRLRVYKNSVPCWTVTNCHLAVEKKRIASLSRNALRYKGARRLFTTPYLNTWVIFEWPTKCSRHE